MVTLKKMFYEFFAFIRKIHPLWSSHSIGFGCWVSKRPKRFFSVTLCRENLSSGENRAGCAELVGCPSGHVFCWGQIT